MKNTLQAIHNASIPNSEKLARIARYYKRMQKEREKSERESKRIARKSLKRLNASNSAFASEIMRDDFDITQVSSARDFRA